MDDDALGRNPLEVELDSIWKVPKKGPVIYELPEGGEVSAETSPGALGGSGQTASGDEQAWGPLDNEARDTRVGTSVEEDVATGLDILEGLGGEIEDGGDDEYVVESVRLVGFKLGYEHYGIDIMNIQEIIRNTEITRVPRSLDFVKGVVNLRGKVIPVISLREKFNFAEEEVSQDKVRIIIVNIEPGGLVGFEVDEVTEVQSIPKNNIVPPPPSTTRLDAEYITGVGRLDEQLIVILNLETLISTTSLTVDTI